MSEGPRFTAEYAENAERNYGMWRRGRPPVRRATGEDARSSPMLLVRSTLRPCVLGGESPRLALLILVPVIVVRLGRFRLLRWRVVMWLLGASRRSGVLPPFLSASRSGVVLSNFLGTRRGCLWYGTLLANNRLYAWPLVLIRMKHRSVNVSRLLLFDRALHARCVLRRLRALHLRLSIASRKVALLRGSDGLGPIHGTAFDRVVVRTRRLGLHRRIVQRL
jgi:hypothetical protein